MNFTALLYGQIDSLLWRHADQCRLVLFLKRIRSQDHAFLIVDAMAGIPDLLDSLVGPGDAAVDGFALPEAFLHL